MAKASIATGFPGYRLPRLQDKSLEGQGVGDVQPMSHESDSVAVLTIEPFLAGF
jgi:hypothetical protein